MCDALLIPPKSQKVCWGATRIGVIYFSVNYLEKYASNRKIVKNKKRLFALIFAKIARKKWGSHLKNRVDRDLTYNSAIRDKTKQFKLNPIKSYSNLVSLIFFSWDAHFSSYGDVKWAFYKNFPAKCRVCFYRKFRQEFRSRALKNFTLLIIIQRSTSVEHIKKTSAFRIMTSRILLNNIDLRVLVNLHVR